ncbi:MAG TPA: hypothetical protein VL485_16980 [Ktedonobacteraceae bacterium]|jgi:hypothetical protein|nr:hypothetical protein [Ktedonobacteraceae bacterium]
MQIVRLPKNPDKLFLATLNKQLRAREICLDWTDVERSMSGERLTLLLAGLNIYDHNEIIGIDTVPAFLQEPVWAALSAQEEEERVRHEAQRAEKQRGATPQLWTPEGEGLIDPDITTIKKIHASQDMAELVSQHDPAPVMPPRPEKRKPVARPASAASMSDAHEALAVPVLPDLQGSLMGKKAERVAAGQEHLLISLLASSYIQTVPALSDLVLDMQDFAITDVTALPGKLQPLIDLYCSWINAHEARLGNTIPVLQQCRQTLAHVQAGVDLLANHREAAQAFSLMNRAMWLQCIHTLHAEGKQRNSRVTLYDVNLLKNRSWRPLQLAFILLNLPGLTNVPFHQHGHRSASAAANLPWFRVGEGKADAYLGLLAYTLALRRLQRISKRSNEDATVIMRYPPRHFPLQQFQHLSALIGACEMIRSSSPVWGAYPFQLGLWEGHRPDPTDDTTSIRRSRRFANVSGPALLAWCPWCGRTIDSDQNRKPASDSARRVHTFIPCSDPLRLCPFSKPQAPGNELVFLVDEAMHSILPPLLVATTDEVAGLPWKGGTQIAFE